MAALNKDGQVVWITQLFGQNILATDVTVERKAIALVGTYQKLIVDGTTLTAKKSSGKMWVDGFVMKLELSTGKPLWTKMIVSTASSLPVFEFIYYSLINKFLPYLGTITTVGVTSVAIDEEDRIFVGGAFSEAVTFGGLLLSVETDVSPASAERFFLAGYTTGGNLLFANMPVAGTGNSLIVDLAISSAGEVVAFGQFTGTLTFPEATFVTDKVLFWTRYSPQGDFVDATLPELPVNILGADQWLATEFALRPNGQVIVGGTLDLPVASSVAAIGVYTIDGVLLAGNYDSANSVVGGQGIVKFSAIHDIAIAPTDETIVALGNFWETLTFDQSTLMNDLEQSFLATFTFDWAMWDNAFVVGIRGRDWIVPGLFGIKFTVDSRYE